MIVFSMKKTVFVTFITLFYNQERSFESLTFYLLKIDRRSLIVNLSVYLPIYI